MAKAKVLADRISITSEILTDENIRKAETLCPSSLILFDEKDETKVLYRVCEDSCNSFTTYGASFKDGKSLGTISEKVMNFEKADKEKELKTILTATLTKLNIIETQVEEFLENAEDLSDDVEFLD